MPKTIVIATDTWHPQVNGVERVLRKTIEMLRGWNYRVEVIHPYLFRTLRIPGFNDLELSLFPNRFKIGAMMREIGPSAIHIATDGPVGLAVRRYCTWNNVPFTTWHHTDYPETLPIVVGIPDWFVYSYMRWFHKPATTMMCNTQRMRLKLLEHGFTTRMRVWSGGVDTHLFRPQAKDPRARKVALYVGRIAKEKGLENFLDCRGDYDKVLVGEGAARAELEYRYPDAHFLGVRFGEDLAKIYANADVFVFPSVTDTFGLVLIEALACGVPVAAYPVQGPADILDREGVGCMSHNLEEAIDTAIAEHDPQACRELALTYSWENSAQQFLNNLAPIDQPKRGVRVRPHFNENTSPAHRDSERFPIQLPEKWAAFLGHRDRAAG